MQKTEAVSWRKKLKAKQLGINAPLIFKTSHVQSPISQNLYDEAMISNAFLNDFNKDYFNLSFLTRSAAVRDLIRNNSTQEKGNAFCLQAQGHKVHGTFFDRGSSYLMIVTGGFSNNHEYMASFIKLFPHYDLVLFDLPGHGLDSAYPTSVMAKLGLAIVGVDLSVVSLGEKEANTISTVVDYFKMKRSYRTVVGVARCYSAPFFAQAAVQWQQNNASPLFDKLIIDSAFPSFDRMALNFPRLFCSKSNAPVWRHISLTWLVKTSFVALANLFLTTKLYDCLPISHYLSQLHNTDLFFIHSTRDVAISMEDFDSIWQQLGSIENKAVLFTHNKHALNHVKQKELFKCCCELFIESAWHNFSTTMIGIPKIETAPVDLADQQLRFPLHSLTK